MPPGLLIQLLMLGSAKRGAGLSADLYPPRSGHRRAGHDPDRSGRCRRACKGRASQMKPEDGVMCSLLAWERLENAAGFCFALLAADDSSPHLAKAGVAGTFRW